MEQTAATKKDTAVPIANPRKGSIEIGAGPDTRIIAFPDGGVGVGVEASSDQFVISSNNLE